MITVVLFPSGILRYRVDFQTLDADPDLDYYDDDDDDDEYWPSTHTVVKSPNISGAHIQ